MELYAIFFIIAGLLLLLLIGFSIWSSRREKSRVFSNSFSQRAQPTPQQEVYDAPSFAPNAEYASQPPSEQFDEQAIEQEVKSFKISIDGQTVSSAQAENVAQQPTVSLQTEPRYTTEPQAQLEISVPKEEALQREPVQSILIYMVAPQGMQFSGRDIVHRLEEMGLQYDPNYQIFQRHIDSVSSPVIFGVANMVNPGIFDLNTIERFQTIGVIFFMNLPSVGNKQANLRLMIDDAHSLAQQLGGFVLDDQGQVMTEESRLTYLQRL